MRSLPILNDSNIIYTITTGCVTILLDSPGQNPLVGVSLVLGMLGLLCIVVFGVILRRVLTNKKQGMTDDV